MTPPPPGDPPDIATVQYRLGQVEAEVRSFRDELSRAQSSILGRIDSLSFVRHDLYESEKRGVAREIASLRDSVAASRAIAMWALGVLVSAVVGGIIVAILAAAR